MSIGSRVKALRKAAGLTQVELAAEADVSRAHVSKVETDGDPVGRDALAKMAKALGTSLDYLQFGGPNPMGEADKCAKDDGELAWLDLWRTMTEDMRVAAMASLKAMLESRR